MKRIQISCFEGTSKTQELYVPEFEAVKESPDEYEKESATGFISFDQLIMTDKIIITILDASRGEKYDDTCISEIKVY